MSDDIQLIGPGAEGAGGGGSGRIQVWSSVLAEIDQHVESDTTVEQGGVLVGDLDAATGATVITARIPAVGAISEVASLRFTHETWDHINGVMERDHPDARMVGWYHSHPHFGIFLSEYDQFIHNNFFSQPWQVAYVVDPLLRQRGFFAWVDGSLVRVPSWETWHTETGAADAPIGTPPPRPAAPPPAPPVAGAAPVPGPVVPPPPDPDKISPWSLGVLLVLVIALVAAVIAVTNPFADDTEPAFRIVVPDGGLRTEATAGQQTPLGKIDVAGMSGDRRPVWSYQPTDGSDTASDAVVVSGVENDPDTFDVVWRSTSATDTHERKGLLVASQCTTDPDNGVCPEDDLLVATTRISLTLMPAAPVDEFVTSPRRFVTGPGIQPFIADERLLELPAEQPLGTLPEGVTLVGSRALADGLETIYQLAVTDDADLSTLNGTLGPHVGAEPVRAANPVAPLTEEDLSAIGAENRVDGGQQVQVAMIDVAERARRSLDLACGQGGVSPQCAAPANWSPLPAAGGPVSMLDVLDGADEVPDDSVAGMIDLQPHVGPDGSCPRDPEGVDDTVQLVADVVRAHPEVLWVIPTTCSTDLAEHLSSDANVVTVSTDPDDDDADLTLDPPATSDQSDEAVDASSALADAQALVIGAAADTWSVNRDLEPFDVIECLLDSRVNGQLQVGAAREQCGLTADPGSGAGSQTSTTEQPAQGTGEQGNSGGSDDTTTRTTTEDSGTTTTREE